MKIAILHPRDEPDDQFGSSLVARLGGPRVFRMPHRRAYPFFLGLLVLASCAAGADDNDPAKSELKRHQGTWVTTSSTFDGQQAPEDVVRSIKRIVTDDLVVWERTGKRFAGTKVVLDSTKEPKTIDVIPDGGRNRGEHILGIYKLDHDTLMICMAAPGQPRPREFKADKGSGWTLQAFVREKSSGLP
jgi:uncharacterized protein (TIGR03067 family)